MAINKKSEKNAGYSRIKSGDHKYRSVTRTPDMSMPTGKVINAGVSLGSVPAPSKPVSSSEASLYVEPKIRTISAVKKESFPFSVVFLALICSVMFMYMIFNYVQINERTSTVSDLKSEIATLSVEKSDLTAKLDKKNDLGYIEKVAREEIGMVDKSEVTKKYITMDPGEKITSFGENS